MFFFTRIWRKPTVWKSISFGSKSLGSLWSQIGKIHSLSPAKARENISIFGVCRKLVRGGGLKQSQVSTLLKLSERLLCYCVTYSKFFAGHKIMISEDGYSLSASADLQSVLSGMFLVSFVGLPYSFDFVNRRIRDFLVDLTKNSGDRYMKRSMCKR